MDNGRNATSRIKLALRTLLNSKSLSRITVAELCREAGVSRTAFYGNYSNTYQAFRDLADDFLCNSDNLYEHLRGLTHKRSGERVYPLCELLRNSGEYRGLVSDPEFEKVLLYSDNPLRRQYLRYFVRNGASEQDAASLFLFQVSGCYRIALEDLPEDQWRRRKEAVDRYVHAGIGCVLSASDEDEPSE